MPFYEYECPACRYYLEVLQKISDQPLRKCPSCGKSGFKRLMSAPVFRLKGSGWYETDFKSDKEGKRNLAGAERDEAKTLAPEATKSDGSKPEAGKTEAAKTGGGEQGTGGAGAKAPAADKARAGSTSAAKARKSPTKSRAAGKSAARRPSRTSAGRKGRR
jgi:putative FmdB family regulatory protein